MSAATSIDAYLQGLAEPARSRIALIRDRIRALSPGAEERISYAIPCARLAKRNAVYYAGWKAHVGVYPVYQGDEAFEAVVAPWRHGTDTLRFPHAKPLPMDVLDLVLTRQLAQR